MKTSLLVLASIGLLIVGTAGYYLKFGGESTPNFKTAPVKRGDLSLSITATGTLEPEEVVDVGAQVQGRVMEFGKDPRAEVDPRYQGKHIDYNSPVEENTVLAIIDDSIYRAARDQAKASLDRANADILQLTAKRNQAEAEWLRAQRLHDLKLNSLSADLRQSASAATTTIKGISDSDFDLAKANFEVAKANAEIGKAAIAQAQAAYNQSETNLGYTVIESPVKGQVIDRRVNIGQTVVASLNAPSMFLIAKDLRRMEVWVSVNEADIGRISLDMPVTFRADAFGETVFQGKVSQIRLNAQQNQNVVLYTVVITVDNSDLKLLPYLTCEVKFLLEQRKDVLLVPNAALSWQPRPAQIAPDANLPSGTAPPTPGGARGKKDSSNSGQAKASKQPSDKHAALWVKEDDFVRPIEVEVGISDGFQTEVSGPDVRDGLQIVYSEVREDQFADAKNPFAPTFRGGRGGGGGPGGGGRGRGGQ
jgi:HlyD family secretion protein